MTSTVDSSLPPLAPTFPPSRSASDSAKIASLISTLNLQNHIEGGYFVETDRDPLRMPNPFALAPKGPSTTTTSASTSHSAKQGRSSSDILVQSRNASTSIHYFLTPSSPLGAFHRNKGRTVHTLHKGRGRYVIIHADDVASSLCPGGYGADELKESERWRGKARIETFVVGQNVEAGERLQWIVEGGKYKASFLLPDEEGGEDSEEGLLISETVVPGFEYADHDFMRMERLEALVEEKQAEEMRWMVRKANA